jgi:hypothetical protein
MWSTAATTVENVTADVDGTNLIGSLTVDISGGSDVDIRAGAGRNTVNTNATGASIDAAAMGSGDTLFLNDSGDVGLFNLNDGATVDGASGDYAGTLEVKTDLTSSESATINTGVEATTVTGDDGAVVIDASDLADTSGGADTTRLTLEGSNDYTVSNLQSDVDAASTSGVLDITTVDDAGDSAASGDDTIAISTGTGTANIRATEAGSTINIDADAMNTNDQLRIGGSGDVAVTKVASDVDVIADGSSGGVSILDGTLDVTIDDAATDVDIFTGNNRTTVTSDQQQVSFGSVDVHAAELDEGDGSLSSGSFLKLDGAADADIFDLASDLDATASDGILDISTSDLSGSGDQRIDLGSHRAGVNVASDATDDTLTIDAANFGSASQKYLMLGGGLDSGDSSTEVIVNNLTKDVFADTGGDVNSSAENSDYVGELTVNTGPLYFNKGTEFHLGTGKTRINTNEGVLQGTAGAIDLTVEADDLDSNTLTISGDADVLVNDASNDVDASGSTGELDVNSETDSTFTVTTGTDKTTVTSAGSAGDITVAAGNLQNDGDETTFELILDGAGAATANAVDADVNAGLLNGELTVNTQASADVSIKAGNADAVVQASGAGTDVEIDATAMDQEEILTLYGAGAVTVNDVQSKLTIDADGDSAATAGVELTGVLTVDLADDASGVEIRTGSANTTIGGDGSGGGAVDTIVKADALDDGNVLTLTGATDFDVDDLVGDLITTPDGTSATATGELTVNTGDPGTSGDISVETSEGVTTVNTNATDNDDEVIIDAAPLANDTLLTVDGESKLDINGLAGDLFAQAGSSALDVALAANSDDGDITLDLDRDATVDASSIDDTVNLTGSGNVTINAVSGDVDAGGVAGTNAGAALAGELTVNTSPLTGDTQSGAAITVITGSNSTTINGDDSQDEASIIDIDVDATALSDADDTTTLSLKGDAEYELTNTDTTAGNEVQVDLANSTNVGGINLTGDGTFNLFNAQNNINAASFNGDLVVESRSGDADRRCGR